jgi:hypothetical protein
MLSTPSSGVETGRSRSLKTTGFETNAWMAVWTRESLELSGALRLWKWLGTWGLGADGVDDKDETEDQKQA